MAFMFECDGLVMARCYMDLILVAQIDSFPQVHGHDMLQMTKID